MTAKTMKMSTSSKVIVMTFAILIALPGCQTTAGNTEFGTLLGAAGGGLLGAQFGSGRGQVAAAGAGILAGALVGRAIGKRMDEVDRQMMANEQQQSLETARAGSTSTWQNPDTGNSGTFTPTNTFQDSQGQYCREYTQTVTVAGETQEAYGTACRQPDGSWRIAG